MCFLKKGDEYISIKSRPNNQDNVLEDMIEKPCCVMPFFVRPMRKPMVVIKTSLKAISKIEI